MDAICGGYGCALEISYLGLNRALSQRPELKLVLFCHLTFTCVFHSWFVYTPRMFDMHRVVCDNTDQKQGAFATYFYSTTRAGSTIESPNINALWLLISTVYWYPIVIPFIVDIKAVCVNKNISMVDSGDSYSNVKSVMCSGLAASVTPHTPHTHTHTHIYIYIYIYIHEIHMAHNAYFQLCINPGEAHAIIMIQMSQVQILKSAVATFLLYILQNQLSLLIPDGYRPAWYNGTIIVYSNMKFVWQFNAVLFQLSKHLTHCGPFTIYGGIELGQGRFRWRLAA